MFFFFQPPVFLELILLKYLNISIFVGNLHYPPLPYTENTMSKLYFNEEIDYSEENRCENDVFRSTILDHRKKLNIFTSQLLIYYM